jgi:hypothetical protein
MKTVVLKGLLSRFSVQEAAVGFLNRRTGNRIQEGHFRPFCPAVFHHPDISIFGSAKGDYFTSSGTYSHGSPSTAVRGECDLPKVEVAGSNPVSPAKSHFSPRCRPASVGDLRRRGLLGPPWSRDCSTTARSRRDGACDSDRRSHRDRGLLAQAIRGQAKERGMVRADRE